MLDVPLSLEPNEKQYNWLAEPDNKANVSIIEQDQEVDRDNEEERIDCSEVIHSHNLEIVCIWLQTKWTVDKAEEIQIPHAT